MGTTPADPSLNARQDRAVACRDVSVVLSSGAGCGKTHVLTRRYLSHLERQEAEVGQIVAITFTDRAARQMRRRIRQALLQKSDSAAAPAEAARWEKHLQDLETAPISTIHAFCVTLLQQHAVEAGLDPRFTVLEDVLSTNLEAEALTACLQRLLTADTESGDDLRELILCYGWRAAVEAIQALMRCGDPRGWQGWLARPAAEVAAAWQALARVELLPRHVRHLVTANPKIARCLEVLRRTRPKPGSRMMENVRCLLEKTGRLAEADDLAAAVTELKEAAKVGGERGKAWESAEDYETIKEAFEGFRKELPERMQFFLGGGEEPVTAVQVGQRFLRVAGEAAEVYQQYKRRNGVVDFQDLLVQARNLVRDHPRVRERLQRRYKFLLVDELQDTDPVQIELIEHLCGAGLTEGKLFAVGDHKQSIYRFRGADVRRFQQLQERVPHEGRLALTLNYRSQPAILDFANALLARHMESYEPLEAHRRQLNPGPCVEFLWSPREEKESVSDSRSREAQWIARRIVTMLSGGETLVGDGGKLRQVRQGDIALLFRTMSNVQLYEAELRRHGLDYYLVGGRAFFAQQEIYDLLNLLRTLENPQDALSLAGTLRSPFGCLSDEALLLLAQHADGLWAGLHDSVLEERLPADQRPLVCRARRFLGRWRDLKDRLPIAGLLGEVFTDCGYDAAVQFETLGERKLANLWKLVDLARTFDRSGLFGLAEFIQRLGDLVASQPREEQAATQPENADVIRLMTIHQAKGLEFPVVFVPDLAAAGGGPHLPAARWDPHLGCVARPPSEEPLPFSDFGWRLWEASEAIEDWREELRTLYVACTRAEDYLVLSAALPKPFSPNNAWMLTLAARFDLTTGACLDADLPSKRVPQIRVTDTLTPVRDWPVRRRSQTAAPAALQEPLEAAGTAILRQIAPIPLRLTDRELLALPLLERYVQDGQSGHGNGHDLTLATMAVEFHAEDGSDRTAWLPPRAHFEPPDASPTTVRDRVLRGILERWDFRHPEAWRPLLQQAIATEPRPQERRRLRTVVEPLLARFAQSDTLRLLAAAKNGHRDLEFLLNCSEGMLEERGPLPLIRGVIDQLWQDAAGDWHVLYYVTAPVAGAAVDDYWRDHRPGMLLAALAVRRGFGQWPATVTLYFFEHGLTVRRGGAELQAFPDRAALEAALGLPKVP